MFSSAIRIIPRRLKFCLPTRAILPSRLQKVNCREQLCPVSVSNHTRQLEGLILGMHEKTYATETPKLSASGQLDQQFKGSIAKLVQEAGLFGYVGESKVGLVDGIKTLEQATEGSLLAEYQRNFGIIKKKPRRKSSSQVNMTVRKIRGEVKNLVNQLRDMPNNQGWYVENPTVYSTFCIRRIHEVVYLRKIQ